MMSRVAGFVRDVLIAQVLGAGALADVFFASFKLANFLRRLFAEGAFNAAFVPMFTKTLEGEGTEAARQFAANAFAALATVLLVIVLLAELFMPYVVRVIATGFEPGGERYQLTVELSRITFPYIFCISLAALLSGMLNAIGRFAAAAFAPVLLNFTLITALLGFGDRLETPAHVLAWGVALAGLLQLTWVGLAVHRQGFGFRLRPPVWTAKLKRLLILIGPGVVGAGVAQINMLVDLWFATGLPAGAVAYIFYADRLNQLPLGVIGIAIGTALLPLLSRQLRQGALDAARHSFNRAIEFALLLTLPAAAALIVVAEPVIAGLYQRGAFSAEDTTNTALALQALALGLPAYVLIKVFVPGFFAREDTRTPVAVAAICLAANIGFILILIEPLAHVGICLATALSNWLNAGLLFALLIRRGQFQADRRLIDRAVRCGLACVLMVGALFLLDQVLPPMTFVVRLLPLIIGGAFVYGASAFLVRAVTRADIAQLKGRSSTPPATG